MRKRCNFNSCPGAKTNIAPRITHELALDIRDRQSSANEESSGARETVTPEDCKLFTFAMQARHTGLRQKKLARCGNSHLYFHKYPPSLKFT
jgi:hypothetical protein